MLDEQQRETALIHFQRGLHLERAHRVSEAVEKFSVIKALQAIEQSHVVILVLDARQGIGEQGGFRGFAIARAVASIRHQIHRHRGDHDPQGADVLPPT